MSFRLASKLNKITERVIHDKKLLTDLLHGFGSPLNLVFPQIIKENLESFIGVFKKHGLSARVNFAHKANGARSFIRELAFSDAGIDVSSIGELENALAAGFSADRIEATGPKSRQFLALCIQSACVINVDNLAELQAIDDLSAKYSATPVKILLRLSQPLLSGGEYLDKDSRFGFGREDLAQALDLLRSSKRIKFAGLAFHLDSADLRQRAVAIESCFSLLREPLFSGLSAEILDIGGGFKANYIKDSREWEAFVGGLKDGAVKGCQLTWNNGGYYGFRGDNGILRGKLGTYEFYAPLAGAEYLDELLNFQSIRYGRSLGELMSDYALELWIEPGRALLDGAGVTVAETMFIKNSAKGEKLVGLNMKRSDIAFMEHEFLPDPEFISLADNRAGEFEAYLIGHLCLESDFIMRRKIVLPFFPSVGDLVIFPNTAAYHMDFSAAESIRQPKAEKVAIKQNGDSISWSVDYKYRPDF